MAVDAVNVVILGAGFGGLELAYRLSAAADERINVTLIDKNDAFVFGFSKFELMLGRQRRENEHVSRRRALSAGRLAIFRLGQDPWRRHGPHRAIRASRRRGEPH